MKAKRFTIVERWIQWYPAGPMEMPQADGKYILATDADRLEAAISRKDEALRRCVEAMKKAEPVFVQSPSDLAEWDGIVAAARAALEDT